METTITIILLATLCCVRSFSFRSKPQIRREAILNVAKSNSDSHTFALLFDCDGVIVETEELHRLAYNKAFQKFGLKLPNGKDVEWDVAYYDILQNTVGGGKPKMNYYFNKEVCAWPSCANPERPPPATPEEKSKLVDELQDAKTEFYIKIVEEVATARPGVLQLMDAALADPNIKASSFLINIHCIPALHTMIFVSIPLCYITVC